MHGIRILAHESKGISYVARMAGNVKIRSLEAACWGLGLALIAAYCGARTYGELERREAISAFSIARLQSDVEAGVRGTDRANGDLAPTNSAPDQTEWSASRMHAYAARADQSEPVPLASALLRITDVGLEVPVYADASERNLNRGAGLIAGTAAPDSDGNVGIAAHRDGYFRALEGVEVGDLVELETRSRRRQYRITELAIVEPTDISPLRETGVPAVTLVTCYPFYFVGSAPQRYIVRAVAIE